jgi:hypothetical protein
METIHMTDPTLETSPVTKARIVAGLFLATIVAGVLAQAFISERLIASTDAAKTAASILANTTLFRAGFTLYMIEMACQIASIVMFYELLKPVNKSVARTAMVLGLTGCGIKIIARLFYYAPLIVLGGASYLSVFDTQQREALSLTFLRVNDQGAAIALIFFGFETVLEGWLIIRSTFLPKFLGVLGVIGGLGWLTFLWPPLGNQLFLLVALYALIASIITIAWLFIRGVDEGRWTAQASLAAASIWT